MKGFKVAVIGAGNMGSGIAQKFAMEGVEVLLVDLTEDAIQRGLGTISALLDQGVERRVFTADRAEAIKGRLRGTTDYKDLADCQLVVEAVFENLEVKRDVFSRLDEVCPTDTILATNTSSYRVADIQAGMQHPERMIGLHYFFHPAKNRLVEVIGGEASDPARVDLAWKWMAATGKTPIPSADACGFVVNRYFVPWINEAVRLLDEGFGTPGDIDRVAKKAFRIGMGPFELMNVTGVPISMHAANTLGRAFGSFYEPSSRLVSQVETGDDWLLDRAENDVDDETITARLDAAAWLAAGELVDEGVGTAADVEVGAQVGLRWPLGPFGLASKRGLDHAANLVDNLAQKWDRPKVNRWHQPDTCVVPAVETTVRDGVATLTLNRPAALNALSPSLIADFEAAFDAVVDDDAITGIILTGAGKAFAAGADLKFFVRSYDAKDLAPVRAFSERAAALFNAIDTCEKPVVALVDGLSLGGGTELTLCADTIVATDRATFGFPETGLGIYPGLGGTQRTTRRAGQEVARWLIFTGQTLKADKAQEIGLADVVTDRLQAADIAHQIALGGEVPKRPQAQSATIAWAKEHFAESNAAAWLDGSFAAEDDTTAKAAKAISRKSPLALKVANELIGLAQLGQPIEEGLAAEMDRLEDVFDSHDAEEGIRALVERRRPTFKGV